MIEEGRSLPKSGTFRRLFDRVLERVPRALFLHRDLAILRKDLKGDPQITDPFELAEYRVFSEGVLDVHRRMEREFRENVIQLRFDRGLWFYALRNGDAILASTWVVPQGERFVDEIGLGFPVGAGDVWMRDIFVARKSRGTGAFRALLDHVLAGPFSGRRASWSAVYADNHSSLRAHEKYGYRLAARFEVLVLVRRLLLRLRWPAPPAGGSSFQADRRLLVTGEQYHRFVEERRA